MIELLVVVSIIAILAGMLLPALQRAREKARSVICSANALQIGKGMDFYAVDYHDFCMPFSKAALTQNYNQSDRDVWPMVLKSYYKFTYKGFICPTIRPFCTYPYNVQNVITGQNCTEESMMLAGGYAMLYNYAYNSAFGGVNLSGNTVHPMIKITSVRSPSRKVRVSEGELGYSGADKQSGYAWFSGVNVSGYVNKMANPHGAHGLFKSLVIGGNNNLFTDGHVEFIVRPHQFFLTVENRKWNTNGGGYIYSPFTPEE